EDLHEAIPSYNEPQIELAQGYQSMVTPPSPSGPREVESPQGVSGSTIDDEYEAYQQRQAEDEATVEEDAQSASHDEISAPAPTASEVARDAATLYSIADYDDETYEPQSPNSIAQPYEEDAIAETGSQYSETSLSGGQEADSLNYL